MAIVAQPIIKCRGVIIFSQVLGGFDIYFFIFINEIIIWTFIEQKKRPLIGKN